MNATDPTTQRQGLMWTMFFYGRLTNSTSNDDIFKLVGVADKTTTEASFAADRKQCEPRMKEAGNILAVEMDRLVKNRVGK